ncbi:MAG: hypothetical protein NVS4B11_27340 [Ktedonobacteraceae bacterium]
MFARVPRPLLWLLVALTLVAVGLVIFTLFYTFGGNFGKPPSPTTKTGAGCNGMGVTKNADGTYHFSRLHVGSQGDVLDEQNCLVHLLGINQGNLFDGNANGTTDLNGLEQKMAFFHQNLPTNIVRINYNSSWWNSDVYVPTAHMHFRQWLQTYVRLEEQAGNYVELDTGPNFHDVPCGNDHMGVNITQCPAQNQVRKKSSTDPTESIYYQPPALQGLTDLAKLYANDAAVLFDVWNEPATQKIPPATYFADMNQRIDTVRAQDPLTVVVVYSRYYKNIVSGKFPNYKQDNLILDYHTYKPNFTADRISDAVRYARAHGQATIINEYGGLHNSSTAQQQITMLGKTLNIGMLYFESTNLTTSKTSPFTLNNNGTMVHSAYTSVLKGM